MLQKISLSAVRRWVVQLDTAHSGHVGRGVSLTFEQQCIRALSRDRSLV